VNKTNGAEEPSRKMKTKTPCYERFNRCKIEKSAKNQAQNGSHSQVSQNPSPTPVSIFPDSRSLFSKPMFAHEGVDPVE
jgi:hypothetical protein